MTRLILAIAAICLLVIITAFLLVVFGVLSFEDSIFPNLVIAVFGGLVVFLGLWIEKESDDDKEKYPSHISSSIRLIKWRLKFGWWILMAGIAIEIVDAGWSACEIFDIRGIAIKGNQLDKPIVLATATATINVRGTKVNAKMLAETYPNNLFNQMDFMKSGDTVIKLLLVCTKSEMVRNPEGISWYLEFGQRLQVPEWNLHGATVRSADEWNVVWLDAPFIPSDSSEVLGGEVRLILNGWNKRIYPIPAQKPDGAGVWNVATKDILPMQGTSNSVGVRVIGAGSAPNLE
jgi:hypothetical protein